jgi:hypothetical protein
LNAGEHVLPTLCLEGIDVADDRIDWSGELTDLCNYDILHYGRVMFFFTMDESATAAPVVSEIRITYLLDDVEVGISSSPPGNLWLGVDTIACSVTNCWCIADAPQTELIEFDVIEGVCGYEFESRSSAGIDATIQP